MQLHEYWSGRVLFHPLDRTIGVFITADRQGPKDFQRSLFREIEQRWGELLQSCASPLTEALRRSCGGFQPAVTVPAGDLCAGGIFELLGLTIESEERRMLCGAFSLAFAVQKDVVDERCQSFVSEHDLVVRFKDWSVLQAEFEG